MFVFQMPAEFSKIHGLNRLQIMLYGNCINSPLLKYLIIFKQLSVLPFLLEDFTACFACFKFEKMESTRYAKMNRKTTTRIILFVKPWQTKHLGRSEC